MNTTMRAILGAALLVTLLSGALGADSPAAAPVSVQPVAPGGSAGPAIAEAPRVELAICLDTSNSMDGLIDSAKQKLWAIVNELATARPRPILRVAVYQYGNTGLDAATGWVQQVCPLTDDLDNVYGKLFTLKTSGGDEYVARVLRAATGELEWSADRNALKMIVVAGNEPATQDPQFLLKDACAASIAKGIIVNTIFCGKQEEGLITGWADAARWADGRYAAIDQTGGTVAIAAPQDEKLVELSGKLNSTYIAYGAGGADRASSQAAQDANALSAGAPAAAQRANAKASGLYRNADWDLVDALRDKGIEMESLPAESLPENMRSMTPEQRRQYVTEQAKLRADLQAQIQQLNGEREQYVRQEMARRGLTEANAFDAALRQAIREQAAAHNITFADPASQPAGGS